MIKKKYISLQSKTFKPGSVTAMQAQTQAQAQA